MSISAMAASADSFFAILGDQQTQRTALAQAALSSAADLGLRGDYEGATREIQRSIGLDTSSENATQAYDLLATVYLQQNRPDDAIRAYKTSISLSPTGENAHVKLGNIYFDQKRYAEAESEYTAALRLNPTSSTSIYSLGQVDLATDRYQEAASRFEQVTRMEPTKYGSHYALGQVYIKLGRTAEAVAELQTTLNLKHDFYQARVDLGSLYADLGEMDNAQQQLGILEADAPDLASLLSGHIDQVTPPELLAAYSTNGFLDTAGPGTSLVMLSPAFESPGAAQEFDMAFLFSKEMDASSVSNPMNWTIQRTQSGALSGAYNWGMPTPATEVPVSPVPVRVRYDADSLTAQVFFLLRQNDTGTGTIDPSHLVFKFTGVDVYGIRMASSADEYNSRSLIG